MVLGRISGRISDDCYYQEMYQEMRRYRDYELTAATWYTTMLLAILGFIVSKDHGILDDKYKYSIMGLSMLIGFGGAFSVHYVSLRYRQIRDHIKKLEPYDSPCPTSNCSWLNPKSFILLTLFSLAELINLLLGPVWVVIVSILLIFYIYYHYDIFPSVNKENSISRFPNKAE